MTGSLTIDLYDILLRDKRALQPALNIHTKNKVDIEILGQYDGNPNIYNEKILSLDVDKILYYLGLGLVVIMSHHLYFVHKTLLIA